MMVRLRLIRQLLFLLILANGTPLLVKILGNRFSPPLDCGVTCADGQPLFGASKTTRGVFLSVLATAVGACLVGLGCKIGAVFGSAAMSGDLFSSFLNASSFLTFVRRLINTGSTGIFYFRCSHTLT